VLDAPDGGAYLEDGHKLWQVLRRDTGRLTVLLEDCGDPSHPLVELPVKDLARLGFRVVRPSVDSHLHL
jgi:hypothetical protein